MRRLIISCFCCFTLGCGNSQYLISKDKSEKELYNLAVSALKENNAVELRSLLNQSAYNINYIDSDGYTLLMGASINGNTRFEHLEIIMSYRPDVEISRDKNQSLNAVSLSGLTGHSDAFEFFIKSGYGNLLCAEVESGRVVLDIIQEMKRLKINEIIDKYSVNCNYSGQTSDHEDTR